MIGEYWSIDAPEVAARLGVGSRGLTSKEADARRREFGPNTLGERESLSRLHVLQNQLRSPLLLLLIFASLASMMTGELLDAGIVMLIVVVSAGIGYSREYTAGKAVAALRARVKTQARVIRDGQIVSISADNIVPGDLFLLSAGSLVPADGAILEATDCYASEAVLTGESLPVWKKPGLTRAQARLAERTNCVFQGTNIRSGTARCVAVETGVRTQFGSIAHRLRLRPPETEFDRGIRHFGYALTIAMLIIVLAVFAVHAMRGRPPMETLLFSIALAVGLSPELLPAILAVNLASGAKMMADKGVLVRRLSAIENLGSMDVLCMDKTGTLTEGVVRVEGAYSAAGVPSDEVLRLAAINAELETGLANPLDDAILESMRPSLVNMRKTGEVPFDFMRKRVSVIVEDPAGATLITKGAFHHVVEVCALTPAQRQSLEAAYQDWSRRGIRTIAVARRQMEPKGAYDRNDEHDLSFSGFVTFLDRPKEGVSRAIRDLALSGVSVKLITGDTKLVAQHIAGLVGMQADRVLTGAELDLLHDEALWRAAENTDLFAEVDPNQKERIILSLKKTGHVVGFLGDGVNDAPAMHASDTSISVEHAVDVAREAADFVLLESDLDIIRRGIQEGRRTFANTLKYVLTTTSANLGNMVSMAAASLFLPFLPLLAGQILLNNFISDLPAFGIAADNVDPEFVARPRRWNMESIGWFMVDFGVLSSVFDFLTFATLLVVFNATPEIFRTGWFVESLLTELAIALVVRTRRPFYRSRPGAVLLITTVILIAVTFWIPYLPFAAVVGFVPVPGLLLATIAGITLMYVTAAEATKQWFYRRRP